MTTSSSFTIKTMSTPQLVWRTSSELLPRRDSSNISLSVDVLIEFENDNDDLICGVGYVEYSSGNWLVRGVSDEDVERVYRWAYFNQPEELTLTQATKIDGE